MKKLVLIDGNSLLNRAYYATPIFTTSSGNPTNAIFGFIKLLFKIKADVKPEYLIVAFDLKAPTFRHKMYDRYKSTRKPMPDDLAMQVEPLKNLLRAMKIAICQKEGIEADDILGTLSKKFNYVHSYIYTGDRDSYQLVDENTDVCFTRRGVSDILNLNIVNFKEETGLNPNQIIDLKALMGDSSDNIPGVPGIGEKTAKDLISRFGSLIGVYENLEEIKGSLFSKLSENKQLAELSYELAKIDRDCVLDINLEDCLLSEKFSPDVKKMFSDFEFKSFLGLNIFEGEAVTDIQKEKQYPEKVKCCNYASAEKFINGNSIFAVTLDDNGAEVYAGGKQYSFTLQQSLIITEDISIDDFYNVLKKIFSDSSHKVIVYDCKKVLHYLKNINIEFLCGFEDLSVVQYLSEYDTSLMDLSDLCNYYLYDIQFAAFAVYELFNTFYKKIKDESLLHLYEDIEKPLIFILYGMECTGVKVSTDVLDELSVNFSELIDEYKNKIFTACGKLFNLNSPAQLGDVLYNNLGITEIKKKKTGKYTTGAEVLEKLADKNPVIGDILKYRFYQKLNSTYIEGFRKLLDKKTCIVHTTFHQTITTTGRLSSSNPNLQNIPVRDDEGRELRKVFVARQGNLLIDADYSQIELRLLAHFSGCKELIDAYNSGVDIHSVTASQVFGVAIEDVTSKMRRTAKAVNFGIIYGISEYGLAKNLNISSATAKEYIDIYFNNYSAVKDYMHSNVEFARANGYISTLTGRKRVIPEINSTNYNLRQFGERAAMNMPLQGSSADIIKIAMINVDKALRKNGLDTKLILQVHDELVLEAPEAEAEAAAKILKYEMEHAVELKVPLTVQINTGKNWYDAK